MTVGFRKERREKGRVFSQGHSPVPPASHLCRERPGPGGHGQGVLPPVAPQLSRASPHGSFPSSCSERGGSFHANEPPSPNNFLMPPWALGQAPVPEGGQWVHWGGDVGGPGVGGHTGSPEQGPPGIPRVPAPIPQPHSGSAPIAPWCPGPDTHPETW